MKITKTLQYALSPTKGQVKDLNRILYHLQKLYNAAIEERQSHYEKVIKPFKEKNPHAKEKDIPSSITYYDQTNSFTEIRKNDEEYKRFHSHIGHGVLDTVKEAFNHFFRRCKTGEKPGYPKFKRLKNFNAIKFSSKSYQIKNGGIKFKGMRGQIKINLHRPIEGELRNAIIKREGKRWTLNLVVKYENEAKTTDKGEMGIDMGISHAVITSNGVFIDNPKFYEGDLKQLRIAQRTVSRRYKPGKPAYRQSKNYIRAKKKVADLQRKIKNRRKNWQWGVVNELLEGNKLIAAEDLNIKGLSRGMLSKQVNDVSWGTLLNKMEFKANEKGKEFFKVNPKNTSQKCSSCGTMVKKGLGERKHECPECGTVLHRDVNAAINVLNRAIEEKLKVA